ncbi:MAG: DnaJ domain-containing protein [Peptoniphilus sp.]|nr:DnaJ domain-containing protein [Peptoniphilus sp.]MDD7363245.1 DnaJ domain-containing protein [Bacillota bacterium]MDY6045338.1 DnaJ domain-containing protein [Peptoniphilus sp.]
MDKFYGNFFKCVGVVIDYVLEFLITVFSLLTELSRSFRRLLLSILFFGGCFVFLILWIPMSVGSTRGGVPWPLIVLIILVFPLIGSFAITRLKYLQYMATEYFYERADYYLLGKDVTYETMGDYGRRYQRRMEAERRRREQAQAEFEEEMFRRQFEQFFNQRSYGDYGSYGGYDGYGGGGYSQSNPTYDGGFKEKYEAAIHKLGLDVTADKYEVKLAYKRLAKKYHPDLNPDEDTTKIFQEINAAHDFLTDEAIQRYKQTYGHNE